MRMCFLLATMFTLLTTGVGCSSSIVYRTSLPASTASHKNIAIFFDGTHNEIATDTNIKKLHSLVTLRAPSNVSTLYVEGVGPGEDLIGMATGAGIGERVRIAYRFLLDNYQAGDKIYIFGFSRGAYSARILASLLYHAGIAITSGKQNHEELTKQVYSALHEANEQTDKECSKDAFFRHCQFVRTLTKDAIRPGDSVMVELLGLWDTVEALGVPDEGARLEHKNGGAPFEVNVNGANDHYGDQLCNVRRAYHALSIDDNREWIFTPLLLTRQHLLDECDNTPVDKRDPDLIHDWKQKIKPERLQEVWFSGAHTDVGGGYQESLLSGITLNWMMEQMRLDNIKTELLPVDAAVPEDVYGSSHDPEAGPWGVVYHAMTRNIGAYVIDAGQFDEYRDRLCVHESVFQRRQVITPAVTENHQLKFLRSEREICLEEDQREGASNPQRLRQTLCRPDKQQTRITIQSWPNCNRESK